MWSLALSPSSWTATASPAAAVAPSCSRFSVALVPWRRRSPGRLILRAQKKKEDPNGGDSVPSKDGFVFPYPSLRLQLLLPLLVKIKWNMFTHTDGVFCVEMIQATRKDILLEYVQNVKPEFMEVFIKRAPQQVVDAMRITVTNMIGTLPPQFFAITVSTVAENLAQLMYSVLMTGYMFRNAQFRLELQQSLEQVALPEPQEKKDSPDFAPGTQKNVSGEVIRWNNVTGPEKLDAVKYIELLETEIEELNRQIERKSTNASNDIMEYLKTLEPHNIQELTSTAGEDVTFAMNTFIKRLLAVSDPSLMKTSVTETSAPELGKLLYWLMVVGYSLRNIEVRFDMERILGVPPKLAELPPGENL